MFSKQTQDDSGVSPVIGVILMVAVTVALVALVTVVVFDLGGDVGASPDATVQLEQGNNDITATTLRNENVDELYLQHARTGNDTKASGSDVMTSAGDSLSMTGDTTDTEFKNDGSGWQDGDKVNVVAVMSDGSEEVLTSTEYDA